MSTQQIKKSDDVAQKLSDRIVQGEFAAGEKLRQDLIAHEYGVSQATAREALFHLTSQGLAVSQPRRGMCVTPIGAEDIDELRTMRCALEPLALHRSVPNLTQSQIAEVEALQIACDAAQTAQAWEAANRQFHMAVISACRMPRMIAEIGKLQLLYARHFNTHLTGRWRRRDDVDHAAILAAIKDRDAERARLVMHRHLMRL